MRRYVKAAVFAACALPLAKLGYDLWGSGLLGVGGARPEALTANPVSEILNRFGFWTLTLLTATLACTPVKLVLGWKWPLALRRMLGLWAFTYGVLHLATYAGLDQGLAWGDIAEDIAKRPFITVGFAALAAMLPLAVTSTSRMVRRLGYARWKRLHRLAYAAAALAAVHFVWRVKADLRRPVLFASILGLLAAVRLVAWRLEAAKAKRRADPAVTAS